MQMKLYDCATAPSPRRVRIFIAEKGLEVDTVQVDLASGEQFGEVFRKLNPDCVVPVLELDNGTCLTEVMGICRYLESIAPEPPLFGTTPLEQGLIMSWNVKVEQQGLIGMADAFRNSAPGLKGRALTGPDSYEQIPELAARGRQRVTAFMSRLDERLLESPFLAGDDFSVADITGLVFVDFARRAGIEAEGDAGGLDRWYSEVSSRPSASA
jgi:glutathione S-transferase